MTGLIITTYNRDSYLQQCFKSLLDAALPSDLFMVIVDDGSTDASTINTIRYFNLNGVPTVKCFLSGNKGIRRSLLYGYELCFSKGCKRVINLDGDAIVKPEFFTALRRLSGPYADHIITGFNCRMKRPDGQERHPIIADYADKGYMMKASVGGINMSVEEPEYRRFIEPALKAASGNWDHMACIASQEAGRPIICTVPSVVQHIGIVSSMGHGGDAPDVAEDFKQLHLPQVTLVGVDCQDVNRLIRAQQYSSRYIDFGAIKLLSSIASNNPHVVHIPPVGSVAGYSEFMIKQLHEHIDTDYALVIQHDGYVLSWEAWDPCFLDYDYIGATWWYKDGRNVGNGGFSLRSRKLLTVLAGMDIHSCHPEDDVICRQLRERLESAHGIRFAPEEVANRFSIEAHNTPDNVYRGQFGFHGYRVDFRGSGLPINGAAHVGKPAAAVSATRRPANQRLNGR